MTRLNVKLSDEEHREFKAQAAYQGLTLQDAIVQAVRDWIDRSPVAGLPIVIFMRDVRWKDLREKLVQDILSSLPIGLVACWSGNRNYRDSVGGSQVQAINLQYSAGKFGNGFKFGT